ncbi:MAG: endo-1,4-beta-xylanase [Janthinobacterium lividum]
MKKPQRIVVALVAALGSHFTLFAQNAPVTVEAETGTCSSTPSAAALALGATIGDWATGTSAAYSSTTNGSSAAATYITCKSDVSAYTAATSPGGGVGGSAPATDARVLTYTVTFPGPGVYDLYARLWVGNGGANDDSYYYPKTFGVKGSATPADWITANGLSGVGYLSNNSLAVDGGGGASYSSSTTPYWKWVDMSKFTGNGSVPTTFTVTAGNLTQTFQIGAREDGLMFDKFVFGDHSLYFTATTLDNGAQGSATAPVAFVPAYAPLGAGKPKYLGSAYSSAQATYFTDYWNAVTPENGGKWGSVEGTRGVFNWADLDSAYNRSVKSGGPFRMHNLIWGTQQPTWLTSLSTADQLTEIKNWYAAVAAHFVGKKIDFIDVVNEPIHTPPTGFTTAGAVDNTGGGYIAALGTSIANAATDYTWIVTSFQLARQYFPNSKLMLNEYSVENDGNSAKKYYDMAMLLKSQGLIDGIGIQGHAFSLNTTSTATIQANMATLASTNLPLYITEFDLDALDASTGVSSDATLLARYQRVFPLFWENPAVRGITLWGFRVGHWRTAQGDNLINADNTERSTMTWLRSYVAGAYAGPMWTGNTSSDVAVASNWITNSNTPANSVVSSVSTYTLPTATDDFYFPGYAANSPVVNGALTARSITLAATTTPGTTVLAPVLTTNAVLTMTGNLTNNGGSVAGTGTVAMNGSATQTIGGTTATTFPNLTVGTATVSLAAPASVRKMLVLNGNLTTNANAFTLLSDATGTAMVVNTSGAVMGTATVQRYIDPTTNAGAGYRHYAAPVAATTVADLATSSFTPVVNPAYNTDANPYAVTPFPTVFDYNSARLASMNATTSAFDYGWESPAALTDALVPGRGYTVNITGTQLVDFVGTLNNGPVSRPNLTRGPQADAGWQLVGNPYPSPLNWDNVSTTGLDAAVYVFRSTGQYAGTYASYVPGGASTNGGTKQLAAMQGFFVRTSSASTPGAVNFANAARMTTYASPTFQRTASLDPLVRLSLGAATGPADETVVYFTSNATAGFDAAADAYKLVAGGTPVLASELSANDLLSINALPALPALPALSTATITVPLRVEAPQAGSYTLRATELLNLPAGVQAVLRDTQTGTLFYLSQPAGYAVSLAAGTTTGRFALLLRSSQPLATASAALSEQVSLYPNPTHGGSLFLGLPASLSQQPVDVVVLNTLGQAVAHQELAAGAQAVRPLALPGLSQGIYTVRLQTAAGTISKRLTIE